jgi:hypothetical protein
MTGDDSGVIPIATVDGGSSLIDFLFKSFDNGLFEHCLNAAS